MLDGYDKIELFGLTENEDCLPIPNDDVLSDQIVRETFEHLFSALVGTGLNREIEPLAHGLASLLFRRRNAIDKELGKTKDVIAGLIRASDGSEVLEQQLEDAQAKAERLSDLTEALSVMSETAAQCYELQTGNAYIPATGGRTSSMAQLTGGVFEAKGWLEAHERQAAEAFKIEGMPLAVAGDRDWTDTAVIWQYLDKIRERFRQNYSSELILFHKADKIGVDAIAAAWARSRKVAQVTFVPNWRAFGKAAGFKAIDQMLDTPNPLGGVAIFGKTGIALNLAQKAEDEGIKVMRIERPKEK